MTVSNTERKDPLAPGTTPSSRIAPVPVRIPAAPAAVPAAADETADTTAVVDTTPAEETPPADVVDLDSRRDGAPGSASEPVPEPKKGKKAKGSVRAVKRPASLPDVAVPWEQWALAPAVPAEAADIPPISDLLSGGFTRQESLPMPRTLATALRGAKRAARKITRTTVTETTVRAHALAYALTNADDWISHAPPDGRRRNNQGLPLYDKGQVSHIVLTDALDDALSDVLARVEALRPEDSPSRSSIILTGLAYAMTRPNEWLSGTSVHPASAPRRTRAGAT